MPPHCDTLDGPVVQAAVKALETGNVNLVLPFATQKSEDEIRKAFNRASAVRKESGEAKQLADYWFFETVVRLHREGEKAPYTGLKPAGLDWGPVVPKADKAIETGELKEVYGFLAGVLHNSLHERFEKAMSKKNYGRNDIAAAREYVQAMLGFVLYSHGVYRFITGGKRARGWWSGRKRA